MAKLESKQAKFNKGSYMLESLGFGSKIIVNFSAYPDAIVVQKLAIVDNAKNSSVSAISKVFIKDVNLSETKLNGLFSINALSVNSSKKLIGENLRTSFDFKIFFKKITFKNILCKNLIYKNKLK